MRKLHPDVFGCAAWILGGVLVFTWGYSCFRTYEKNFNGVDYARQKSYEEKKLEMERYGAMLQRTPPDATLTVFAHERSGWYPIGVGLHRDQGSVWRVVDGKLRVYYKFSDGREEYDGEWTEKSADRFYPYHYDYIDFKNEGDKPVHVAFWWFK